MTKIMLAVSTRVKVLGLVCVMSVLTAQAYDLIFIVENSDTRQRIMDYTPQAFSNDGCYNVVAEAKPIPADSAFVFKGLPDIALNLGAVVEGNLLTQLVSEPRDTLIMSLPGYFFAKQLQEVVVKGDSRYMTDEKSVFLPTKRDKRISAGGAELLNALAMPTIKVNPADKSVRTVAGEAVTFYIDYIPATAHDVANIRTADVERVEVFDYPKDPVFMGAQHVVNFVMVKYKYGGYTKLSANQRIGMNEGGYGVASKLSAKKMTYDLSGGFGYYDSNHVGSNSRTWYKFTEGELTRDQTTTDTHQGRRGGYATLRAVYRTDKSTVSNTFGFAGGNAPGNYTNSLTTYNPPLYESENTSTRTNRSDFSLSWKGFYQWQFNNGYSLVINPGAAYSRYNNRSTYLYDVDNAVINDALDKSWNVNVYAEGQKQMGRHSFGLSAATTMQGNVVHYTGTTPSSVHTTEVNSQLRFIANLRFNKVWLQGNLALRHQYDKLNDETRHFVNPHIFVTGSLAINSRQSVNMAMEYALGQISLSELSPTIIQTNNIDAVSGNPDLNHFNMFNIVAQYQYMFSNELSASAYCNFNRLGNIISTYYTEGVSATGPIMIKKLTNSGFLNNCAYGVNVTARLLNNNLTLQAGLSGTCAVRHGVMNYKGDYLTFNANAMYSIAGWYASVFYNYRNKDCQAWGYSSTPQHYGLDVGWGNGDWNVSAKLNNPFTKSMLSATALSYTDNYQNYSEHFSARNHCNLMLSVVYSFSYGKKVQRGNEAGQISGSGSAILE